MSLVWILGKFNGNIGNHSKDNPMFRELFKSKPDFIHIHLKIFPLKFIEKFKNKLYKGSKILNIGFEQEEIQFERI